ncbi:flagellar hook-length control protein FliK [Yoonia algicola]|uniref:Flagellar hook-length control protein FliK n=1 Tax=Yoonia algicola TaxID=3137368 RepID=A0AAN0M5E3_9RHOB
MIPLILSQPGTATAPTASLQGAGADIADRSKFGDVMAMTDLADADVTIALADGALAVPIPTDIDIPALTVTSADADTKEGEIANPLPEKATGAAMIAVNADTALPAPKVDNLTLPTRDSVVQPIPTREAPTVPKSGQLPTEPRETKTMGASVAQSVIEGRLPLKGLPGTAAPQASPPMMKAQRQPDAPPPAAPLVAAGTSKAEIPRQTADINKSKFQPREELSRLVREDVVRQPPAPNTPTATVPTVVASQPPAVALAQAVAQLERDTVAKTAKPADADSIVAAMPAERQTSAPGNLVSMVPTGTPETARQAAAQIAVAVTNSTGQTTEIALNPEELGRVKLSLSGSDSVITVNVLTERPETQDLLRRHIDILAQEFRQLGYTSISFSFGEQNGQAQDAPVPDNPAVEPEVQDTVPIAQPAPAHAVTGLDLRI